MQQRIPQIRILRVFAAAALAATVGSAGAQTLLIDDSAMALSNYQNFSLNSADLGDNPDDLSFANDSQQSSGGNPGAYLEVTHNHEIDDFAPDPQAQLFSVYEYVPITYTPSTSGTLVSVDFSLDIRVTDSSGGGTNHDLAFTVGSNNTISVDGFTTVSADGTWNTVTVSGLVASDFPSQDFAGSTPLLFGFQLDTLSFLFDNGDGTYFPEESTIDVDNFQVTITTIPEPTAAVLLALFGMLGCCIRRR